MFLNLFTKPLPLVARSILRAAQKATKTIPIVMMAVSDAVMLGFVDSLARPGGNITGLTTQAPELGENGSSYSRR